MSKGTDDGEPAAVGGSELLADEVYAPPPPYGLELLESVSRADDGALLSAVSTYPGLLSFRLLRWLHAEAQSAPMLKRRRLVKTVERIWSLAARLDTERDRYPLGAGPVEATAARVQAGELGLMQAKDEVSAPTVRVAITPLYTTALMGQAIAQSAGPDWRHGLTLARLTIAAADAAGTAGERGLARKEATLNFLLVALPILRRVPDGRLLREAFDLGERAVTEATEEGDRLALGQAEYRLGSLLLDPITAAVTYYQERIDDRWRHVLLDEYGAEFRFAEDDFRMPPIVDALARAEQHYRRSLELRDGNARGMAAKALLETLQWRRHVGADVDDAELQELGRQALADLDPSIQQQHRTAVAAMLGELPADATSEDDPIALVLEAQALLSRDPERELAVLARADRRLARVSEEQRRHGGARLLASLCRAWVPDVGADDAEAIRQRGARGHWPPDRIAAALVAAASQYGQHDAEREGLAVLKHVEAVSPAFSAAHDDGLRTMAADLWMDAGSSARSAGNVVGTVDCYVNGLSRYLVLGLRRAATAAIRRIADMLRDGRPGAAAHAIAGMAALMDDIDRLVDRESETDVQMLLKRAFAALFGSEYGLNATLIARQMGKGHRFAAMLTADRAGELLDKEAQRLLELIAESEAEVSGGRRERLASEADVFIEDKRLLAYVAPHEALPGATAEQILENRRRAFDDRLNRRLVGDRSASRYLTSDDIQSALDDRTVLLDYFLGMSSEGEFTVCIHCFTRERGIGVAIPWVGNPDGEVYMGGGDVRRLYLHAFGLVVARLRQNLIADPGFDGNVTVEAGDRLAKDLDGLIGPALYELLEEEHGRGRDHICLVPHGPLHFHPMHLIGRSDHPLAQDFAVSFLPNLQLLTRPRRHRPPERAIAAIGMTFTRANPYGMPVLPQAADEVAAVASVYGIAPLIDDDATGDAVLEALSTAGTVHLFTHGTQDIAAPAFQCVYVSPGAASDGRVTAHELLDINMSALDLVTLSACETGLGRFDRGDNLRGLPASLLLAGASTLVGTLWEVGAAPSAHFFRAFHAERRRGTGKLDAFARAQRDTRDAFPAYRDWGAFQFVGDWR